MYSAGLHRAQGRAAEAESLYRCALASFESALEPAHPKRVTCLTNYAELLRELNRDGEAGALEKRARTITRQSRRRR
jgi:hypothetical protein